MNYKSLIIDLLDTLGLGRYGVLPHNPSLFADRISRFTQHFSVAAMEDDNNEVIVTLANDSGEGPIIIKYKHEKRVITSLEVL